MINIQNIRLGFANNSSSSHSIVFLRGDFDDFDADSEFGWSFFTAASKRSKENYLISTVAGELQNRLGVDTAKLVLSQLLGRTPNDIDLDGYVDHQSRMLIPNEFRGVGLDLEFFNELKDALLQDGVVILGGNDNDETSHELLRQATYTPMSQIPTDHYGDWVARKDGDMWALFNRENGNKIRFSFKGDTPYTKSRLPELVDIKITDFCPYNCPFCYQGSTLAGKHAEKYTVFSLAKLMGEHKVFEVALGGGETTLHPEFVEILAAFRKEGVVPNFTTRNLQWLRGENKDKILELCGSFAYSTEKPEEIVKLNQALEYHHVNKKRVSLQFVAGVTSAWELKRLCEEAIRCGLGFTILGYKDTGRGGEFKPKSTAQKCWEEIKTLRNTHSWLRVGIDTVFAEQIKSDLEADGINSMFYHTKDGVFSCYIDAVAGTMAPSSYCLPTEHKELATGYHAEKGQFARIYQNFK